MNVKKELNDLREQMLKLTNLYGTPNNNQKKDLWNSFNKLEKAINYSQCCMGETVLDEDVSVNIEHKSLGKFTLVKKQDSETELLFCKCGLKKGGTFRCMRTDCDSMD